MSVPTKPLTALTQEDRYSSPWTIQTRLLVLLWRVTWLVLFLVQVKVVPETIGLVPRVMVVNVFPEQMVCALLVTVATGTGFTVMVTVPVICRLQEVAVSVAKTLKVVVIFKLPVGRLIVPPVPATALPTFMFPELFRN